MKGSSIEWISVAPFCEATLLRFLIAVTHRTCVAVVTTAERRATYHRMRTTRSAKICLAARLGMYPRVP